MDAVSRIKIYYFYNNVNMAAFLIRLFSKGMRFGKLELRIVELKKNILRNMMYSHSRSVQRNLTCNNLTRLYIFEKCI